MRSKSATNKPEPESNNMAKIPTTLTATEIREALNGITSKTLTRWYQQKLIPPPTKQQKAEGRGREARWDAWVKQHCITIHALTEKGYTLADIGAFFGSNWIILYDLYQRTTPTMLVSLIDDEARQHRNRVRDTIVSIARR